MEETEGPEQALSLGILTMTGHSVYEQWYKTGTIKQNKLWTRKKGQQERVMGLLFAFCFIPSDPSISLAIIKASCT